MKQTLRILPLLAALLLPVFTPRAAGQTHLSTARAFLTEPQTAAPYRTGELSKDAMATDSFQNVYSAGYRNFPAGSPLHLASGGPPDRRGVVYVHTPTPLATAAGLPTTGQITSPLPDSVYTGVAVNSGGTILFVVGTMSVSTSPEMFIERWHAPFLPGSVPAAVWMAGSSPLGFGPGKTYGGEIHRYGGSAQLLVSGSWTNAGQSKIFAHKFDTSSSLLVPYPFSSWTPSVIAAPGLLSDGIPLPQYRWGTDVFRWHPRAFMELVPARFYLGGTIGGDIHVNRFHQWDGLPSASFFGQKTWTTTEPDLMTALAANVRGLCVTAISHWNVSQGFLYCWTPAGAARAGASPYWFGSPSGVYDVKVQTVGPWTHVYVGGFATAMGGGWVWHFRHPGSSGALVAPSPWPFFPYSAPGHPWGIDLPVFGLALGSTGGPGNLYATGQHELATGFTGQIVMKVTAPWTTAAAPSWSSVFPGSGPDRHVLGHTIQWHSGAGGRVFSHGNGTMQSGTTFQSDGEVMAFNP